ncbi:hypothetical protein Fmac_009143 [Flemingia macrophylla]|uniref:Pentatricopeptide repeat-containing protein n=1 Tax=Flemingia macrophylla TaxID=520843 RepID=A0ABD1MZF6_9FABA
MQVRIRNMKSVSTDIEKDASTQRLLATLRDHFGFVNCVRWAKHGRYVASSSELYIKMKLAIKSKLNHINPTMEHYLCMIDLYSHVGMLGKAMDIINGMPFPPAATVWRSVLAASRVHRNIEFGKLAAEKIISLEPQDSAAYVLLSDMYAAAGTAKKISKLDQKSTSSQSNTSYSSFPF